MNLSMGILSEDTKIADAIAFLFDENFITFTIPDEEELFLWLEAVGDEVDTLIIDATKETSYSGHDLVAVIGDEDNGWPNIKTILMGQERATFENKTGIWGLSINADYLGYPCSVEELVSVVSGQLTRLSG